MASKDYQLFVDPYIGMVASVTLRGIELVRMIRKGQMKNQNNFAQSSAEIFYSLAA